MNETSPWLILKLFSKSWVINSLANKIVTFEDWPWGASAVKFEISVQRRVSLRRSCPTVTGNSLLIARETLQWNLKTVGDKEESNSEQLYGIRSKCKMLQNSACDIYAIVSHVNGWGCSPAWLRIPNFLTKKGKKWKAANKACLQSISSQNEQIS